MTGLDSAQLCGAGRQRLTGRGAAGACVFVQERSGARRAPPGSVRKSRGEGGLPTSHHRESHEYDPLKVVT